MSRWSSESNDKYFKRPHTISLKENGRNLVSWLVVCDGLPETQNTATVFARCNAAVGASPSLSVLKNLFKRRMSKTIMSFFVLIVALQENMVPVTRSRSRLGVCISVQSCPGPSLQVKTLFWYSFIWAVHLCKTWIHIVPPEKNMISFRLSLFQKFFVERHCNWFRFFVFTDFADEGDVAHVFAAATNKKRVTSANSSSRNATSAVQISGERCFLFYTHTKKNTHCQKRSRN